jgi:hypothetical protein
VCRKCFPWAPGHMSLLTNTSIISCRKFCEINEPRRCDLQQLKGHTMSICKHSQGIGPNLHLILCSESFIKKCGLAQNPLLHYHKFKTHTNTKHIKVSTTGTIQSMYTYHCHNTKHVHVPLSEYKARTPTALTTQNMYTYRCHNTKHVHVPLSQYKTCTRTAVTIQNMYTYRCRNTKHVHVPLSQYETCTRTTIFCKY